MATEASIIAVPSPIGPIPSRDPSLTIPTLIILSMLVFLSVRFIPGDIVDVLMQEMMLTGSIQDVDREAVERRLGLE